MSRTADSIARAFIIGTAIGVALGEAIYLLEKAAGS